MHHILFENQVSMQLGEQQNLGISPVLDAIKRDGTNLAHLSVRSFNHPAQNPEKGQQSVEEINLQILQQELIRTQKMLENERNEKWEFIHRNNYLENQIKVFDAERINALGENQKIRNQIREMITKTDQLNREKVDLLNEVHNLKNKQRLMASRIQNLQSLLEREKLNHQRYTNSLKEQNKVQGRISELNTEIEILRVQNLQFEQNLSNLKKQHKILLEQLASQKMNQQKLDQLTKQNKTLLQELRFKNLEVQYQKSAFLQEKSKLENKSIELQRFIQHQEREFETTSRKLQEINQFSEHQNKKLMISIETDLTNSMTFGKVEQKRPDLLQEQCYQKEMKINHLSREVLELQRTIREMQNVNSYNSNQYSMENKIFSSMELRECFKNSVQPMTPKQFNLYNEIEAKRMKIQELEQQNRILSERLQEIQK